MNYVLYVLQCIPFKKSDSNTKHNGMLTSKATDNYSSDGTGTMPNTNLNINSSQQGKATRIQNPYARKRPRPNPSQDTTTTSAGQPSHYYSSTTTSGGFTKTTHSGRNHNVSSMAGNISRSNSTTTSGQSFSPALPQSSQKENNKKRDSFDSFEDSFDWDEAIRVADQSMASSQPSSIAGTQASRPTQGNSCTSTSSAPGCPSHRKGLDSSMISNTHNVYNHPVIDVSHEESRQSEHKNAVSTQRQQQSMSCNNSVYPPGKPPLNRTAQRHQNSSMASLRPAAWSNNPQANSACASPQLSQQLLSKQRNAVPSPTPHQHPLIARLPVALRFDPEVIQPANDNYKKDLIKHASLGKPLANGWTLFDHQKKAVLKALLMRKFILALDMGLGTKVSSSGQ